MFSTDVVCLAEDVVWDVVADGTFVGMVMLQVVLAGQVEGESCS